MTHLWAVVLGVLQGVAEFLPISSTAHLKLVPWVFGVRDPMLSSMEFDIALHAGSFVAIVIALWRQWADLVVAVFGGSSSADSGHDPDSDPLRSTPFARRFVGFLALTSIPGALFGVVLAAKIEYLSTPDIAGLGMGDAAAGTFHYAPLVLGIALILFGVALWASDRFVGRNDPLVAMNWWKALTIGLAQAAALIPGVSRSGSTMMAGRLVGLRREVVAQYSFMAALPIIGGAALFGLRDVAPSTLLSVDWVLGFSAAAISSVLVMRWMLSYVRDHSFAIFMWYRIAVGVFVIALFFIRG